MFEGELFESLTGGDEVVERSVVPVTNQYIPVLFYPDSILGADGFLNF